MQRAFRSQCLYLLCAVFTTFAPLLFCPAVASASVEIGHANTSALSQGLVGYWTFDGSTISWATGQETDSSGKGNTGLLVGMSTTTSPLVGRIGQALNFNGSSYMSLITVPGTLSAGGTPTLSISAWVRRASASGGGAIVNYSPQYAFDIGVTPCTGSQIKVTKYSVADICIGTFPSDTKFHLLTAVWSNTGVNVYIDGVLNGTSANVSNFSGTTSGVFGVGYDSADHVYFSGTIDDVRVYNRALSSQEVSMLYALGEVQAGNSLPNSTDSKLNIGLDAGLVGEWIAGGNTINWATGLVQDVSGNGDNGHTIGMSTSTAPTSGKIGEALNFNGTSSYIDTGSSTFGITNAFSISAWVYPTTVNMTILSNARDCCGSYKGFNLFSSSAYSNLTFGYWDTSSGSHAISTAALPINTWTYVAATFSAGTGAIYENGVLVTSGAMGGTGIVGTPFSSDTMIGRIGATSAFYSSGKIDDVRLYNRALSAQEINDLYKAGQVNVAHSDTAPAASGTGINAGLVGYWTFDGPTINWATGVVNDMSGSGNNAQIVGMSTTTSPVIGKIGQALMFNGTTAYLATGYTIPAQSSATSDTWSAWMKLGTGNIGTVVILGFRNGATWMKLTPSAFEYSSGSIISHVIPTGVWLYITIVKSGSSFTYYQNGAVIGTASNSGSVVSHTFYIGGDPGFPSDGTFSGTIDDVRIYNRALSSQEVQQLYLMGK